MKTPIFKIGIRLKKNCDLRKERIKWKNNNY